MSSIVHSNPHGPLNPRRLSAFEIHIGAILPDEYRHFLVAHNGAGLTPREIILPGQQEPYTLLSDSTFGLHEDDCDLERVYDNCRDVLPPEVIAFAEDHGGNLLCIGIRGERRGKVYFWDHDGMETGNNEPDWDSLMLLAGSFNSFVTHLGHTQLGIS